MEEIMLVLFLLVFYIFISYLVYVQLLKGSRLLFFLISVIYLPLTYYFQVFAVRLDNFLIYNNLFVESRHTNELLVALFFVCIGTAFLTVIAAIARRENSKMENSAERNWHQVTDIENDVMPAKYAQQNVSL